MLPLASYNLRWLTIRHFRNNKGTGAEMRLAIVSGIVSGDTPVSCWSFFDLDPINSAKSPPVLNQDNFSCSLLKPLNNEIK